MYVKKKARRTKLSLLSLLFFSLYLSTTWAVTPRLDPRTYIPTLSNTEEEDNYLEYLKRIIPQAFETGMHFIDPRKTVQKEQLFLSKINTPTFKATYESELPERHVFLAVDFDLMEQVTKQIPQIKSDSLGVLKNAEKSFSKLAESETSQILALQELIRGTHGLTTQGLLTGMIQCLPQTERPKVFPMDIENKIKFLEANLTQDLLAQNFRSNVFDSKTIQVGELIEKAKELVGLENRIAQLSMLIYLKRSEHPLIAEALQNFDLHKQKEFISKLDPTGTLKAKDIIQAAAAGFIKAHLEFIQAPGLEVKARYTIEEVSPHIGLFRGTINNDCFTTMAFGFAYSPAERTWVLKNSEGKILFSIYSTEVTISGEKTLYIHDMGRADASPTLGEFVPRAFYSARKALGFTNIAYGTKGMHFSQFQKAMKNANTKEISVPIKFIDEKTRNLIGDLMVEINGADIRNAGIDPSYAKSHDLPSAHSTGIIFSPKEGLPNPIQVTVRDQSVESLGFKLSSLPLAFSSEAFNRVKGTCPKNFGI